MINKINKFLLIEAEKVLLYAIRGYHDGRSIVFSWICLAPMVVIYSAAFLGLSSFIEMNEFPLGHYYVSVILAGFLSLAIFFILFILTPITPFMVRKLVEAKWIPGHKERMHHLEEYTKVQMYIHEKERFQRYLDNPDSLIEDFKANEKEFVQKYFNSHQSLLKHYLMKAHVDGEINKNFILNSLIIPRRHTLPTESLKNIFYALSHISHAPPVKRESFVSRGMDNKFSKYSNAQIVQVFTRHFTQQSLITVLNCDDEVFPVCSTLGEIAKEVMGKKEFCHPKLMELNNQSMDGMLFKVVLSSKEYERASKNFSNCVRDYFLNKHSDIVTVYRKDTKEPLACVQVSWTGKIAQILGPMNMKVNPLEEAKIKRIVRMFTN